MPLNAGYSSYLLRLWQLPQGRQVVWVASLHNAAGGEQHSFRSVEALIAFLRAEYGACQPATRENTPGAANSVLANSDLMSKQETANDEITH